MKQKDLAQIILVVGISFGFSWIIFNSVLPKPDAQSTRVEVVQTIDSQFPAPPSTVFKKGFLNPTELIRIGNQKPDNSANPFDE